MSLRAQSLAILVSILLFGFPAWAAPEKSGEKSGEKTEHIERQERLKSIELFHRVLDMVERNYVDEVKNKDLVYGAIRGMLETLDPHSNFLAPEIYKDMQIDTTGKFGGIGIEIGLKDGVLTVISPIEDTPAWKAGVKPGDRIVKINGESTKGLTLSEAIVKMRGSKNSAVRLSLYRDSFDHVREFKILREEIKIQSVKSAEIEPYYGYVRLTNFSENAASDMKKAITQLQASHKLRGLVFDLRNNPGGLLDQAVEVGSLFVDEGVIVSTVPRAKDQKELKYAKKGQAFKDFPVAVLVNSSTASAAEIVAGALQDHRRAVIMGQTTFGKGSVQSFIPLGTEQGQDFGMKLTIARYYTPSGRSIQEKGVQPDILVEDYDPKLLSEAKRRSDAFREKDLRGHMLNQDHEAEAVAPGESNQGGDFKKEELEALNGRKKKPAQATEEEEAPTHVDPKDDYQVREALNYLKGFDVYRKISEGSPYRDRLKAREVSLQKAEGVETH